MMPFEWSVQPYQFKNQLVEAYTKTVMIAGKKTAYKQAVQAEAWMRQNAPWRDRSLKERVRAVEKARREARESGISQKRSEAPYLPGARRGLRAYVTEGDFGPRQSELDEAAVSDRKALADINKERRRQRKEAADLLKARVKGTATAKADYKAGVERINRELRSLGRLPAGQSQVKALKSDSLPLATINFSHHRDVHYAVWLEIAMGQRYAIISKTVEHWGPIFFNEMRRIANLKQYRDKIAFGPEVSQQGQFEDVASAPGYEPWSEDRRLTRKKRGKNYTSEKYLEDLERMGESTLWQLEGREIEQRTSGFYRDAYRDALEQDDRRIRNMRRRAGL